MALQICDYRKLSNLTKTICLYSFRNLFRSRPSFAGILLNQTSRQIWSGMESTFNWNSYRVLLQRHHFRIFQSKYYQQQFYVRNLFFSFIVKRKYDKSVLVQGNVWNDHHCSGATLVIGGRGGEGWWTKAQLVTAAKLYAERSYIAVLLIFFVVWRSFSFYICSHGKAEKVKFSEWLLPLTNGICARDVMSHSLSLAKVLRF